MLYTYNANKKANSTTQILTGTVKEVLDDKVVIFAPTGYNKSVELTVNTADLELGKAPEVGMPVAAIGMDNGDGTFDIDTDAQKEIAGKVSVLKEFERCKENKQTKTKTMEHSAFMMFPLSKSSQVKIDEEKQVVTIPANVAENSTVWLRFTGKGKFNHFEDYTEDGKKRLGIKAYAQMLQKKLDNLQDGQVLVLPLTSRFESWVKDEATGEGHSEPIKPQANGDKLSYSVFANGENALGLMLNTAMEVQKSFVFTARANATQDAAEDAAPEADLSSEEEMALLAQAMA